MKINIDRFINNTNSRDNTPQVNATAINTKLQETVSNLKDRGLESRNDTIFNAMALYLAETSLGCRREGLLFSGGVGAGKTWAGKVIAGFRGLQFYTSDELLRWYLADREAFWEAMDEKKTIVIDDLGDEVTCNDYGNKSEVMGQLIVSRYRLYENHAVRTIITSNLTGKDIAKRYGARVYSRLKDMCKCVNVKGDDLRNN